MEKTQDHPREPPETVAPADGLREHLHEFHRTVQRMHAQAQDTCDRARREFESKEGGSPFASLTPRGFELYCLFMHGAFDAVARRKDGFALLVYQGGDASRRIEAHRIADALVRVFALHRLEVKKTGGDARVSLDIVFPIHGR